jgi:hypothetical protein
MFFVDLVLFCVLFSRIPQYLSILRVILSIVFIFYFLSPPNTSFFNVIFLIVFKLLLYSNPLLGCKDVYNIFSCEVTQVDNVFTVFDAALESSCVLSYQ